MTAVMPGIFYPFILSKKNNNVTTLWGITIRINKAQTHFTALYYFWMTKLLWKVKYKIITGKILVCPQPQCFAWGRGGGGGFFYSEVVGGTIGVWNSNFSMS